jgi:hypothetical protein
VTEREPEFTDQDRAELLALAHYRGSLCPNGCGQPLEESTAHYEVGPEYDATKTTCRACAALAEARRGAAEADGGKADRSASRIWRISVLKG